MFIALETKTISKKMVQQRKNIFLEIFFLPDAVKLPEDMNKWTNVMCVSAKNVFSWIHTIISEIEPQPCNGYYIIYIL